MRVAVTGAGGFIGHHVIAELEKRSLSATLVARSSTRLSKSAERHAIVQMDLADPPPDAFELMGKPDVLIHLAWDGLPNYKSAHHFEEVLPAQHGFLNALIASGLQNLVVAGTCFEYGMISGALSEDMPTRPTNPYGLAKDTLRRRLECLQGEKPFFMTWARFFYLYGEGQAESSLRPQLEKAVERGDPVFNMSGGEQLRDYLPVGKAAEYLVSLAIRNSNHGIVNICSGNPISVRELVEKWIQTNGWPITPNPGYYPYPDYEPMEFWGDREKLNRCLKSQ